MAVNVYIEPDAAWPEAQREQERGDWLGEDEG